MGQRVSSCFHPRFTCSSNSVYPNYRDYEKLKSQPDSVNLQKHHQDCEKLKSKEKDRLYLQIHPQELHFPIELRKESSCTLRLSNKSDHYVAFKVRSTCGNAQKYYVDPSCIGVVLPMSTCDILVTMLGQKEAAPDMQCKDMLRIQSIVARPGVTAKHITSEMFHKDSGYVVDECKLRVVYLAPPSSVFSKKEGALISKLTKERNSAIKEKKRLQKEVEFVYEVMSKLAKERRSAIEQNKRLLQELKLLRHEEERNIK